MKDKWLKDLRNGLSDYEMDAPEGLWENLQKDMAIGKEPLVNTVPKHLHSRNKWFKRIIAAASIIFPLTVGIGFGLWLGKDGRLDNNEIKLAIENKNRQHHKNSLIHETDNRFPVSEKSATKETTINIANIDKNSALSQNTEAPTVQVSLSSEDNDRPDNTLMDVEQTIGNKNADECEIHEREETEEQNTPSELYGPRKQTQNQPKHYTDIRLNINRNKIQEGEYYVGIITSGMSSTATDKSRKINNPNYNGPDNNSPGQNQDPNDIDMINPDPGNNSSNGLGDDDNSANSGPTVPGTSLPNEEYIDEITKSHHHQPIKFGLTFQYNFNKRLGIETGIMYTRLSSDITTYSIVKTEIGRQTLHYVGIPLNIKFSAWSWKCLDIYLSAGITGEKCIHNELITTTIATNTYEEVKSLHGKKPFQWSTNFGAGLQIRVIPTVSIFAEPGVSYYFDDGSSLNTIYKEKPCNFNLNIGLRLSFGK